MDRNQAARRRQALWIERLAWNAAAGASILLMIWVLLCSLTWLDRIAPTDSPVRTSVREPIGPAASLAHPAENGEVEAVRPGHPSG